MAKSKTGENRCKLPNRPKRIAPHSGVMNSDERSEIQDHMDHAPVSPVTGEEYGRSDACPDDDLETTVGSITRELENIFGYRHHGLRLERA